MTWHYALQLAGDVMVLATAALQFAKAAVERRSAKNGRDDHSPIDGYGPPNRPVT